jgi:hypothetical protein
LPAVELPVFASDAAFDAKKLSPLGESWIGHQHYAPTRALLDWAQTAGAILITCIRHPGDVLVSYRHHVRLHAGADSMQGPGAMLLNSTAPEDFAAYVRSSFFVLMHLSLSWVTSRRSLDVRYEDLWRDPAGTLADLCAKIAPVPLERIKRAVEQCEIDLMRELTTLDAQFFRKGGVGSWRDELSHPVIAYMREVEPYPSQFAALGYSIGESDPLIDASRLPWLATSPFHSRPSFDNGVRVPAIVNHLYLSFPTALARSRWPEPHATESEDSFYQWLAQPAEDDPRPDRMPLISNLAAYVHSQRSDVQHFLPNPFGMNRAGYALWFLHYAAVEFKLDDAFIAPMREGVAQWSNTLAMGEFLRPDVPPLTELAVAIYEERIDVQATFPDLYERDRVPYLLWFFEHAVGEYRLDPEWTSHLQEQFAQWAESVHPADTALEHSVPAITRLALYL